MAPRRPSLRTTVLVVAGVAGVVLAHGLDYLLVIRSPVQRAAELAETGHAWWSSGVAAALGAACLALSMATAQGATGAVFRHAARSGAASARRDFAWTAAWQTGVFAALEVLERLGAHVSPLQLLHGPLFAVGVLLQVAVAAVVVILVRTVERGAATAATTALARRRSAPRARRPVVARAPLAVVAANGRWGRHEARGPPVTVAA
jgi:hypothetical protein